MKLTKYQQNVIAMIKRSDTGRVWINAKVTPKAFTTCMKLVDRGILSYEIDGNGIWFSLI